MYGNKQHTKLTKQTIDIICYIKREYNLLNGMKEKQIICLV